ncbi:MAG: NADP-specific glutamate dehydrogenase [Sphaerochaetaceae bacterium]|nr:NADP-specific glutamate dehydrogenase [Sphaerochaetaceae bacterium]NLO59560.1 NADP-specific glutamate dehydrogenase [Spirochaetales bacterium]MDD2405046.1 NADP-specific glutamate dehydrogenase [Sphaerochaetaceae bacterium]MDD3669947.1 NADP-specific glutamate dehydrogenase [Sphaerochaetaceae bacterium]MDD4259548.1 NADP-specific glutamate dehydrogenase [Sphaerochaetaceae bacterium]
MHEITADTYAKIRKTDPDQIEFHQAVNEFLESVDKIIFDLPHIVHHKILDRMIEPERVIMFRIPWIDDQGDLQVNRGFRVQMNSALGPYKGGLRFHPSVNLSIMKFLAFEQVLKNSLTGLQIGGGKGGSDFDPKGKSDGEVMRFCQSLMIELSRHIGEDTDVPAGDIGVGAREIGFLFGQFKRLQNRFTGVLTGKGPAWGGSYIRPEATGYGLVYFAAAMLQDLNQTFEGKTCLVSGSGNVAQYTVEKLNALGAKVITLSDSSGCIYDPQGIDAEKLAYVKTLKNIARGRIYEYAEHFKSSTYYPRRGSESNQVWDFKADCAFPCATQNEINELDAKHLVSNGVRLVAEGANMPTTIQGVKILQDNGILFAPAKAANAGGVAVSGLEMAQNSSRIQWTREAVDQQLQKIMKGIHNTAMQASERYSTKGNLVDGANIAGFLKVANAMVDQGYV